MSNTKKERERPYYRDLDDPEFIKELQRPAVIKEDLSEMERRKRVRQILESKSFCDELEHMIRQDCDTSQKDPDRLQKVQKLSELTNLKSVMSFANLHNQGNIIGIADIKNNDKYSKIERNQRNKLASLFRIAELFQWAQGINNEITFRMRTSSSNDKFEYLMNPYGLLYQEITAGSLIKLDEEGIVLDGGILNADVNFNSFLTHTKIYNSNNSIKCILHMHTAVVAAVSSMKCGLIPLCQEAMIIGPIAYCDFEPDESDGQLNDRIATLLTDKNVIFLRNRGFIVAGESVEHVAFLTNNVIIACETQVRAARVGLENLVIPNESQIQKTYRNSRNMTNSLRRNEKIEYNIGDIEWESWMRVLDHANYKTGHIYRQPQLRSKSAMAGQSNVNNNDVALPPSASAYGQIDETDSESVTSHRLSMLRKEQERVKWLNSPNAYQKVEFLEYGADNPKKITKWVQDTNSPSASGTPVKINSVHQFSPASKNPKEFKEKQRTIKENRRLGTTTAGPQSQIFESNTFDDISLIVKTSSSNGENFGQSTTNDRAILIGTASKGIIDRQYQHHAQVYQQIYAPNPFSIETDEDIRRYMEYVSRQAEKPPVDFSIYADCEGDTVSLMQGVREHKLNQLSASDDQIDKQDLVIKNAHVSQESIVDTSLMSNSVVLDYFPSPAISPIMDTESSSEGATTSRSFTAGTDDLVGKKDVTKKKKKGFLSFIRKKDKASTSS
ncbi:unnamed protein product [Caenorhabditis angaria]|uniref:Class II aldolase/adducin N-terminal domain-containing protein n=1 Tax=Caenorhabditis angaria TaxID=860376 RepID=A0A9P1N8X2_9PELO|nr:unnamed protein product [Caenorhabditis angaria]